MAEVVVFYVDGAVIDSVTHNSPWADSAAAQAACWAYCQELNVWWDAMWTGDVYCDESYVLIDTVHPNAPRSGCMPAFSDDPPMPSFGGYEVEEMVWNEWNTI